MSLNEQLETAWGKKLFVVLLLKQHILEELFSSCRGHVQTFSFKFPLLVARVFFLSCVFVFCFVTLSLLQCVKQ